MRYGQAVSEQGVGGFTTPELNGGRATQEGAGSGWQDGDAGRMRREQGYGGDGEMSKSVGA